MPNPGDYENQDDFVSACIAMRQDEHPEEDTDQSAAICYSEWRDKAVNDGAVLRKVHSDVEHSGLEFVLSDATIDRYGDSIIADGWELTDFKKNPIALFNHNSDFPIGRWKNLRVKNGALRGHLEMAPEGTSARIDELRKLIDAGILRAVSVGFRPIESKPRSHSAPGEIFVKSDLVECSLVTVPANPNALAIAKGMNVSPQTMDLVFAKNGSKKTSFVKRGINGKHAAPEQRTQRTKTMSGPLAQRIKDAQDRIVALRDELNEHMKTVDDDNPTEEQTTVTEELTTKIETQERSLEALKKAEAKLAVKAVEAPPQNPDQPIPSDQGMIIRNARPFAVPARKVNPVDYIFRALTVQVKHHAEKGRRTMIDVLKSTYGEDEGTLALMNVLTRTATAPATTTSVGWAADLVTVAIGDFFGLLQPVSIYARLSGMGGRFTFGPSGVVSMPTRSSTPTVGGAFVGQGDPIPVKKAAFTAITMTPKKVGVISSFTREIAEHSTPSIEALIRDAIVEDTANAIDTKLMSTDAASTTAPAGLLNGLSAETESVDTTIAGVIADTKTMMGKLFAGTNGNVRTPVWLTTPGIANAIALASVSTGTVLPFKDEVSAGRFMSYPIIQSTNVTAGQMILMDAADFVTATGDSPRFDVSDQAVLHFEDTTPLDITTAAVGTTVKSLWQTDSVGIRMIMDLNWAMRRSNMIYFIETIAWD